MTTDDTEQFIHIGLVSISDRASSGVYEDQGVPALKNWLDRALTTPWRMTGRVIADDQPTIEATLRELVDNEGCGLVLTTGGTGPAPRDQTPEAMARVMEKELAGFGEQMRRVSLEQTPTAILSRQTAGIRGKSLIINLPGKPSAIETCLDAVFGAIPYCLDLIGGGYIETNPDCVYAFRPGK